MTQNIDDLHERAGSRNLLHIHGELLKIRCERCGTTGDLRPHVVWFGEMPLGMDVIFATLERCELFLSIGTSGNVYPAAGFVAQVRHGAHTAELNLEPSEGASLFAEARYGPATQDVPTFVDELLANGPSLAARS